MSGAGWIVRLGAIGLLLGAVACGTPCCGPKVYEIKKGASPNGTLNILFLGDGFKETELPLFRAAASHLTETLVETWPFCRVKDQLAFYRIDVWDDGQIAHQGNCSDECPPVQTLDGPGVFQEIQPAVPVSGWKSSFQQDLGVTRCFKRFGPGRGPCRLLWPSADGETEIRKLMQCGPKFSVAVVIANWREDNGGGLAKVSVATDNLAVVGVPMDDSGGGMYGGTQIRTVDSLGHRLFAHELAHALGLLDENVGTVTNPPSVTPKRNVWEPSSSPPWGAAEEVPWADLLGSCKPPNMVKCCPDDPLPGACMTCDGVSPSQTDCVYVSAECQPYFAFCANCNDPGGCPDCDAPSCPAEPKMSCPDVPFCDGNAAAWEGAHHARHGLYRASYTCQMGTLKESPFCPACASYLWKTHFCPGPVPCPNPTAILAPCP